jgi:hypothetical protein
LRLCLCIGHAARCAIQISPGLVRAVREDDSCRSSSCSYQSTDSTFSTSSCQGTMRDTCIGNWLVTLAQDKIAAQGVGVTTEQSAHMTCWVTAETQRLTAYRLSNISAAGLVNSSTHCENTKMSLLLRIHSSFTSAKAAICKYYTRQQHKRCMQVPTLQLDM